MADKISLVKGSEQKNGYIGFSWSTLLLGCVIPFARRDLKYGAIILLIPEGMGFVISFITHLITSAFGLDETLNMIGNIIVWIIFIAVRIYFAYTYNRTHLEGLLQKGFQPADTLSKELLSRAGIRVRPSQKSGGIRNSVRAKPKQSANELLKEGFALLKLSEFDRAGAIFEQLFSGFPENSGVYLGALMVERRAKTVSELANSSYSLENDELFQNALNFASPKMKQTLTKCLAINRSKVNAS